MFEAKRTQVAQSAFNFSQYFGSHFENVRVAGPVARRPALTAPEGMSTAGGRQARQTIVLQPEMPGVVAVTVGWVEVAGRRAMLRSYRCLLGLHRARFRDRPFDVDIETYDAFFENAQSFLAACGMAVTIEDDAAAIVSNRPPPPRAPEPVAPANPVLTYAAIGFVAFVLGAFAGGLAVYARFVGF